MANSKSKKKDEESEDSNRKEIRITYDEDDKTYKKIVANAKEEERSPAKEVKVFLKTKYK